MPRSNAGVVTSSKYRLVVNACASKPSATAPHISVIASPTPATNTFGNGCGCGSGVNIGVISLCV
jgi:hypothetical protein